MPWRISTVWSEPDLLDESIPRQPAVGVMVADMLTGKSDPEFDPHLFRAGRYAENDPVRGTYEYSIAG